MALRWISAAMLEAAKGFRCLKAYKQLPTLLAALLAHQRKHAINPTLKQQAAVAEPAQPAMPAEHISTGLGTSPQQLFRAAASSQTLPDPSAGIIELPCSVFYQF